MLAKWDRTPEQFEKSFWGRVDKSGGEDACWPWTAATNNGKRTGMGAYGIVWFNARKSKTHRMALQLSGVDVPAGMLVCHKCDNPPCCNPAHLFVGTDRDNNLDKLSKNRGNFEKGDDRYNAVLNADKVREIRARYSKRLRNGRALAQEFGVGNTMIHAIVHRRRWKHV